MIMTRFFWSFEENRREFISAYIRFCGKIYGFSFLEDGSYISTPMALSIPGACELLSREGIRILFVPKVVENLVLNLLMKGDDMLPRPDLDRKPIQSGAAIS